MKNRKQFISLELNSTNKITVAWIYLAIFIVSDTNLLFSHSDFNACLEKMNEKLTNITN